MTVQTQNEMIQTTTIDSIVFSFTNKEEFTLLYNEIFKKKLYSFATTVSNPVILDCGAHIGVSILFFKKHYPHAKIIAFEPSPKTFKLLELNVKQNNLRDVKLVNAAVSDKAGEIDFYVTREEFATKDNPSSWHWGDAAVKNAWYNPEVHTTIKVPTVKLSSYIDQRIDFLKLDIEGMEERALSEIEDKLSFVNEIRLEYHGNTTNPAQSLEKVIAILDRNHFYCSIEKSWRIIRPDQVKRKEHCILLLYTNRRRGDLRWQACMLPLARFLRLRRIQRQLQRIIKEYIPTKH